ncbi:helix-turn-helix domain-containing protein [Puniceicoccaceae bacterium K14]|nr:helix-turn-helix domain-containing protein [Puniceicoccaceae bacterium K14]
MNVIEQDQLISIKIVASRLDLSTRGVYRLIARGDFPRPVKVGGASRFYESDLGGYLNRLKAARKSN